MCDSDLGEQREGLQEPGCAGQTQPGQTSVSHAHSSTPCTVKFGQKIRQGSRKKFLGGKRNRKTKQHGNFSPVESGISMCGLAPPAILHVYSDF